MSALDYIKYENTRIETIDNEPWYVNPALCARISLSGKVYSNISNAIIKPSELDLYHLCVITPIGREYFSTSFTAILCRLLDIKKLTGYKTIRVNPLLPWTKNNIVNVYGRVIDTIKSKKFVALTILSKSVNTDILDILFKMGYALESTLSSDLTYIYTNADGKIVESIATNRSAINFTQLIALYNNYYKTDDVEDKSEYPQISKLITLEDIVILTKKTKSFKTADGNIFADKREAEMHVDLIVDALNLGDIVFKNTHNSTLASSVVNETLGFTLDKSVDIKNIKIINEDSCHDIHVFEKGQPWLQHFRSFEDQTYSAKNILALSREIVNYNNLHFNIMKMNQSFKGN